MAPSTKRKSSSSGNTLHSYFSTGGAAQAPSPAKKVKKEVGSSAREKAGTWESPIIVIEDDDEEEEEVKMQMEDIKVEVKEEDEDEPFEFERASLPDVPRDDCTTTPGPSTLTLPSPSPAPSIHLPSISPPQLAADEWGTGDDEIVPGGEDEEDEDIIETFEERDGDVEMTCGPRMEEGVEMACPLCGRVIQDAEQLQRHANACLDLPPSPPTRTKRPLPSSPLKLLSSLPPPFSNPSAHPSTTNPSAFSVLMSQNKESIAWASAEADYQRGQRPAGSGRRKAPFYKVMQGMPIAVDAFRYGKIPGVTAYLLTHAHSDHYTNLSSSWKNGPIYCSHTTANLIALNLKVPAVYIKPLPLNTPTILPDTGGVTVTLIEANHCPGSVLFLFVGRQTINAGDSPISAPFVGSKRVFRYLHCGDFRACPRHALADGVRGKKLDLVYLDTTYLNPRYCFPPQKQVIDACAALTKRVVQGACASGPDVEEGGSKAAALIQGWLKSKDEDEKVKFEGDDELKECGNAEGREEDTKVKPEEIEEPKEAQKVKGNKGDEILVVIGTYSIGKERIVKAIAHALSSQVYCDARKRAILEAQSDPELHALLSSDPHTARVHLLPLQNITVERMTEYLDQFRGRYSRVLGFRPTGWTYTPPAGTDTMPDVTRVIARDQKRVFDEGGLRPIRGSSSTYMLYGVPYSEHSSFFELTCFALSVDVTKIIATVNVGSAASRGKMAKWFEKWEFERRKRRNAGAEEVVKYRAMDYW